MLDNVLKGPLSNHVSSTQVLLTDKKIVQNICFEHVLKNLWTNSNKQGALTREKRLENFFKKLIDRGNGDYTCICLYVDTKGTNQNTKNIKFSWYNIFISEKQLGP